MSKTNVFEADTYMFSYDPVDTKKDIWLTLLDTKKDIFGKNKQMNLKLSPERARRLITMLQRILDKNPVATEDHDDELEEALALF